MPDKNSKLKSQKSELPVKKTAPKKVAATKVTKPKPAPAKLAAAKVNKPQEPKTPRGAGFSIQVYSLLGKAAGNLSLPKEIFGVEINKKLLAQAIRVYTVNQKNFTASTKSRGEVRGSTAKVYRQKGTGGARHGSIRAPIYVGGGIVFGPKPRKVVLDLPKMMKKKALLSALSAKVKASRVLGLSGIEKATGKTKEIAGLLQKLNLKNVLIVTGEKVDSVVRGGRNIPGVDVLPSTQLNAYEVLKHQSLLVTKEAVEKLSGGAKK